MTDGPRTGGGAGGQTCAMHLCLYRRRTRNSRRDAALHRRRRRSHVAVPARRSHASARSTCNRASLSLSLSYRIEEETKRALGMFVPRGDGMPKRLSLGCVNRQLTAMEAQKIHFAK